jgi:hypothetical protein
VRFILDSKTSHRHRQQTIDPAQIRVQQGVKSSLKYLYKPLFLYTVRLASSISRDRAAPTIERAKRAGRRNATGRPQTTKEINGR